METDFRIFFMDLTEKQIEYIKENCDSIEIEETYDDMLNECYDKIHIGVCTFSPSYVIKELDPIAYHCGLVDYFADEEFIEIDGEYYYTSDVDQFLDEFEDEDEGEDN